MKKSSKHPESKKVPPSSQTGASAPRGETPGFETQKLNASEQHGLFEEATSLFHGGDYRKAREKFLAASQGSNREMSHTARLHVLMCEQRLARMAPELNSPEDHYNYAIALINRRELGEADRHLKIASSSLDDADHVLYALALCQALQGDLESSYEYLRRAIQIDPRNRSLARSDPDFQDACRRPPLRELVHPSA